MRRRLLWLSKNERMINVTKNIGNGMVTSFSDNILQECIYYTLIFTTLNKNWI